MVFQEHDSGTMILVGGDSANLNSFEIPAFRHVRFTPHHFQRH